MNRASAEVKEDANRPETYRGMSLCAAQLISSLIQQMRSLSCLLLALSLSLAIQFDVADVENPAFQPLSVSEVACLLEVRRAQLEEVRLFSGPPKSHLVKQNGATLDTMKPLFVKTLEYAKSFKVFNSSEVCLEARK